MLRLRPHSLDARGALTRLFFSFALAVNESQVAFSEREEWMGGLPTTVLCCGYLGNNLFSVCCFWCMTVCCYIMWVGISLLCPFRCTSILVGRRYMTYYSSKFV